MIHWLLISIVLAWGNLGHRTTGLIAQHYLSNKTKIELLALLPEYNGILENATLWADQIRKSPQYKSTHVLHSIKGTFDFKNNNCKLNNTKDCLDNQCITGAITKYIEQAKCTNNLKDRNIAIKYLAHLLGDVGQPLHTTAHDFLGLYTIVRWSFLPNIFHIVWDSKMIEHLVTTKYNGSIYQWTTALLKKMHSIKVNQYKSKYTINEVDSYGFSMMALQYSQDSADLNCGIIWDLLERNRGQDLKNEYFEKVVGIVEEQIMKSGYRMAMLFNELVEDCEINST